MRNVSQEEARIKTLVATINKEPLSNGSFRQDWEQMNWQNLEKKKKKK